MDSFFATPHNNNNAIKNSVSLLRTHHEKRMIILFFLFFYNNTIDVMVYWLPGLLTYDRDSVVMAKNTVTGEPPAESSSS